MSVPDPATTEWVPLYGPAGLPGPPDLNYKGAYAAGAYKEGDIVIYQGVAYLCVTDTSEAPTPWPVTGTPVPTPVVNGQWLKGVGGAPVWTPIVAGDISSAVNGQFLKGAGGVGSWAAITGADTGLKVYRANATSDVTPIPVAATPVPGATLTFTTSAGASVAVASVWDLDSPAVNNIVIGQLEVDGSVQGGQALFQSSTTGARCTFAQNWLVLPSAGSHTYRLSVRAGSSNTGTLRLTHTNLMAMVFPA